eukprot:TRINITY_DN1295_c0_g1_i1.p1 TRINITY_DN1295_c0_g1~~TRINITY_DN1295_c0_g1_i1.p1  ORF type:complete len:128 (+),score=29.41 TRINITY_DN1295_c0_g1_i1:79-462(+)
MTQSPHDKSVTDALNLDQERINYKLRNASYIGNDHEVADLLDEGAEPNAPGKDGNSALHMASDKGFAKVARHLMDYGGNPSLANRDGKTSLQLAANHPDVLKVLQTKPASVKKPKTTVWGDIKRPGK